MHPPQVDDQKVLALIHTLSIDGRPPSGAALRAALAKRYGSRGGVTRIYRLLRGVQGRAAPAPASPIEARLLSVEADNLRVLLAAAARAAEQHQAHWSGKVNELQQQIQALEQRFANAAAAAGFSSAHPDIHELSLKADQLEVLLRLFGPTSATQRISQTLRDWSGS